VMAKEPPSKTEATNKKKDEKPKETTAEFLSSTAEVFITGLFIITFIMQAFEIPSGSMLNTLLIGDHLFVDRVTHAPKSDWISPIVPYRPIHHDEIIVFITPADPPGSYLVKRIVGLPGDHLKLVHGDLYRNGQKLTEPYAHHDSEFPDPYRDEFPAYQAGPELDVTLDWRLHLADHVNQQGELVVPPGYYFGMGDNRDNSRDSRFWGLIPQENIVGRPMVIYWSFETPANQYTKASMGERIGFVVHIITHFFTETRWKRTFRLVH
jgi:signal peptidase I